MNLYFKEGSPYTNRARNLAMLWTLLIFILCSIPGRDLPKVRVPLADKWAHVILFGVFSFLWHCATPTKSPLYKLVLLAVAIYAGWLVEYVQGHYIPDRSQDMMDVFADSIGGLFGILVYSVVYSIANREKHNLIRKGY